jgi:polar amino acid transport system ATP-binding protein/putative ABC transport system ATP-binding protein
VIDENSISDIRKRMAWIPQNINLPVNSGSELMELLELKNQEKVNPFLNRLGLEKEFLHQDFKEISGGQKQRIVIAVCLSMGKKIIFMDEPTAALDDETISSLIETVTKLKDTTVISASHNQQWIESCTKQIKL